MTTPTTLRTLLQSVGLGQAYTAAPRSLGGGYGDYSVRFDTTTNYTGRGRGYRVRQRSTRIGLLRVELEYRARHHFDLVAQTLTDVGYTFTTRTGDTFLVTPQ